MHFRAIAQRRPTRFLNFHRLSSRAPKKMTKHDPGRNLSLEEMDKQSLLHPYTSITDHLERGPVVITKGHAARVTDSTGRNYIDSMAGLWCVNIGHGRQEMVDAITEQASKLAYYHIFFSMSNEATIRLADEVLQLLSLIHI